MNIGKYKSHTESDESLWTRVVQKDPKAVEAIYRRYFGDLYRYGMSLCGDEEVVKDCIQELFVRLLSPQTRQTETAHVRVYLFVSLRNAIVAHQALMSQHVRLEEGETFDLQVTDDELATLFTQDDRSLHMARKLREAFKKLNANQRQAIYLHFIKEFSWEETGRMLHITPHSCMNLIARALVKMRTLIIPSARHD